MNIIPDFTGVRWSYCLEPLNFAEVARRIAAETKNTMVDDILANQFADELQAFFLSFFRDDAPPVSAAAIMTFASLGPADKRQQIEERAKAAGVALSPLIIAFLVNMAWPLIERFLFSRKTAA